MAGIYSNKCIELNKQTKLNGELLNEVNLILSGQSNKSIDELKKEHLRRVNEEYAEMKKPIYAYFDGTNLINSLFSTLIVPYEYLKSKKLFNDFENKVDDCGVRKKYKNCKKIIFESKRLNWSAKKNNGKDGFGTKFKDFLRHMRNALCHSGDDSIEFRSTKDNPNDISLIIFKDCNPKTGIVVEFELTLKALISFVSNFDIIVEKILLRELQKTY